LVNFKNSNKINFLGKIMNEVANPNCKMLVVANPVNNNAAILSEVKNKIIKVLHQNP
jgi:hypothetical protein